jgi:predicted membrane chloride channel (bestrophin family)
LVTQRENNHILTSLYRVIGIVTTPIPFPMVQMSRTFLFFYIYTLPSALLTASSTPAADLVVLFIVTYGFIGLELISIELDDPFGDDVIDFDTIRSIDVRTPFICCGKSQINQFMLKCTF